jgi:transcriptional regulator
MVALTAQQENGFTLPWQVDDAPQDFTERLIGQVVGIEIPVSRWMGKWKVSQNQPLGNRDSVVAHLEQQKQHDSEAMAEYVLASLKDGKKERLE